MEEEIYDEGDEIGEIHLDIRLLEKDIILYDMNEEKL